GVLAARRAEIVHMLVFSFGIDTLKSFGAQADILVLGALRSAAEVADYRLAQAIVDVVNRLAGALLMVAFPAIARLTARGDLDSLRRLLRRSSVLVAGVVVPGCVLLYLTAPLVVRLAGGPGYEQAAPVLRVLVWSTLWIITY